MNVYSQWATYYGGKAIAEFEQTTYLQDFPAYLRGGCCMTLCCNWIGKKADMAAFITHVNSDVGKAQVRGFQGMATKAADPASKMGGYFVGYANEVLKIYKATWQGEIAMRDKRNIDELSRFVGNKSAYYQLHFKASANSSGHAVAFHNTGNSLQLFDPNYGMVEFSGGQRFGQFNFMLTKLLRDFYPDLDGQWECMRVYNN